MKKKVKIQIISGILILIMLAVSLFPFYYMVVQSLQPWKQVDKSIIPRGITLRSYEYLLNNGRSGNTFMWIRALANSLLVSLPTAIISSLSGLLIGYAMVKIRKFRGQKFIMNTLLFQMFFSGNYSAGS